MSRYRYEVVRADYSHFASGNVFVSAPGHPGFPVRLASEIFQTCLHLRTPAGAAGRVVLYDPCCGAGYLLATTAFRHWEHISCAIGSDLDEESLVLARTNLSLLAPAGVARRRDELATAEAGESRASRRVALDSLEALFDLQTRMIEQYPLGYRLSRADAGSPAEVAAAVGDMRVDVAMVDIPYGELSDWQGSLRTRGSREEAISGMFESLLGVLSPRAVVAIVSPKTDTVAHPGYERRRRFKLGKRMVSYLSAR